MDYKFKIGHIVIPINSNQAGRVIERTRNAFGEEFYKVEYETPGQQIKYTRTHRADEIHGSFDIKSTPVRITTIITALVLCALVVSLVAGFITWAVDLNDRWYDRNKAEYTQNEN